MNTTENSFETVLDVKDLTVQYITEGVVCEAVTDISFSIGKGRTLGLVGETGAGKTTAALAVMQLVPDPPGIIKSGSISVCGNDMRALNVKQLESVRGGTVSMIFQDPMTSLNPVMTVGDQITEAVLLHNEISRGEARKKANEMLELVGIPAGRSGEYPHQFSGGMKQRVVIAIALSCNPHLLLADEPTTALDVTIQAQVLELMRGLRDKLGTSMLMISHDLGIISDICDEVAVMYAGRIIEYGTLEDVYNNTCHPYTEGLFNSLPNIENRSIELKPIPGSMPDPTNLPKSCAFAPRCPYATEACRENAVRRHDVSPSHYVMCTRYDEKDFHVERRSL